VTPVDIAGGSIGLGILENRRLVVGISAMAQSRAKV